MATKKATMRANKKLKLAAIDNKWVKNQVDGRYYLLQEAIYRFDYEQASELLQEGLDIDFHYPPFGNTLLMDMIETLALTGEEIVYKGKMLHGSSSELKAIIAMIRWLIAQGASLNAVNNLGNTAMILAAAYGDHKLLAFLYHLGAKVNAVNSYGESAISLAAHHNILTPLQELVPNITLNPNEAHKFNQRPEKG